MDGKTTGKVYLVGAGPGAPEYLSLRAAEVLGLADVLVYDNLVGESILERFAPEARKIYVGKEAGKHTKTQEEICALLVALASSHDAIVRLKGGDPYVFGRGAEEAEALREAGIPFEVVPGITAAQGAAATAGIPLTHRAHNASLALVTGHEDPTKGASVLDYEALARSGHVVFYMGVGRLKTIAKELVDKGLPPDTPAAVVRNATLPDQEKVTGTASDIAARSEASGIRPPALVFFGPNAASDSLDWFTARPLFGATVVVTRSRAQASALSTRFSALGARVIEFPVLEIVPATGEALGKVDEAARSLSDWDWIVFTSTNGVDVFLDRLRTLDLDARAFAGVRIGAIGEATAARLGASGLVPDFVPSRFTTRDFCREFFSRGFENSNRFLLARAREANPELARALREKEASVTELTLYDTRPAEGGTAKVKDLFRRGAVTWVTFTSSSTVRNFRERVGAEDFGAFSRLARYASIGPVTSATLREFGVEPAVEGTEHTIPGLVDAILGAGPRREGDDTKRGSPK
ncbi:MAG: uroporphyrinogen-III C-methyltransferase [Planctomycetota bacterium]|jgi:uroporphyrinogen III methyltransferase/synthase